MHKSLSFISQDLFSNFLVQVVDVLHPKTPCPSRSVLTSKVAALFNVPDSSTISLFGFKQAFGGGRSTGFCLIYDNINAFKKFEPKYRRVRVSFLPVILLAFDSIKAFVFSHKLDEEMGNGRFFLVVQCQT
jgi:ribosomal protein S24E